MGLEQGDETGFRIRQREHMLRREFHTGDTRLQRGLDNCRRGNSMTDLIGSQHLGELLQHISLHLIQLVLQLIRLISQCRQQQREDRILLDALQLVRMVTAPPDADGLL